MTDTVYINRRKPRRLNSVSENAKTEMKYNRLNTLATTVYAPNRTYPRRLRDTIDKMRTLGAPTIRAVWDHESEAWIAIEGSHRLEAARQLGLLPVIVRVEMDQVVTKDPNGRERGEVLVSSFLDAFDGSWEPIRFYGLARGG